MKNENLPDKQKASPGVGWSAWLGADDDVLISSSGWGMRPLPDGTPIDPRTFCDVTSIDENGQLRVEDASEFYQRWKDRGCHKPYSPIRCRWIPNRLDDALGISRFLGPYKLHQLNGIARFFRSIRLLTIWICNKCDSWSVWDKHLTTQAQRPGARDATTATATLPPGSLQRMVRPHASSANHQVS
jgi:hypothetical protein